MRYCIFKYASKRVDIIEKKDVARKISTQDVYNSSKHQRFKINWNEVDWKWLYSIRKFEDPHLINELVNKKEIT